MRLQLDTSTALGAQNVGAPSAFQGTSSAEAGKTGNRYSDSVSFSDSIGALQRVSAGHAARLQRIAASVHSGSYTASSLSIAAAIIGHAGG